MKLVERACWRPSRSLLGLVALATFAAAQDLKLNDALAREQRGGSVSDFLYTHDGTRVVYRADRAENLRYELFSRPLDLSGPSVRLNGPMHAQGDVGVNGNLQGSFALGAGDRIVYVADETVDNVSEVFSVPADGSASRVRLSQAGLNVRIFELDPAGTRVLYVLSGTGTLSMVPIDGSAAPISLAPGRNVRHFWTSPDGATTVFGSAAASQEELYAVPTDGSAPPLLLALSRPPAFLAFTGFDDLLFTPDGLRVVYNEVENSDDDLNWSLYTVPLDASQPQASITNGPFYGGEFAISPAPAALPVRVAFRANSGIASTAADGSQFALLSPAGWTALGPPLVVGTDVLFELFQTGTGSTIFRAPMDGSLPAAALFPAGSSIGPFVVASPTTLAFVQSSGGANRLNAVPLTGGTPLPLHALPPSGQGPIQIIPHPDGQRVLFRANNDTPGNYELYVVPLDASQAPLKLNGPLAPDHDVFDPILALDQAHVAFRVGMGNGGHTDLEQVALDGSGRTRLNEPVPGATVGDVTSFRVTPDGARLVYRADQESDEHFGLYALDTSNPGSPLPLSAGLESVLPDFAFSPPGDHVVFQTQGAQFALYGAALAGGAPTLLDASAQTFVSPFEISADGARCVYRKRLLGVNSELRSVAMDGLSPPVVLHPPLSASRTVAQFQLGAGGVVVFLSDRDQDEVYELYATPIDGSAPPFRLSQTLVSGGDVTDFRIDASGASVVYIADAAVNNRFELYEVPTDGSRTPRRLNGTLPPGGDVTEFALTPDGERVVYRADELQDFRVDLFSVPIGGSAPAHGRPGGERRPRVTVLSALTSGRAVQPDWSLSPDGTQVVYRANADSVTELELYRAPVNGRAAPTKLSAPLVANGDVLAFAIAPDQSRVVYRADPRIDEVQELFSVPFAGGAATELDPLPAFADVSAFQITPDSGHVVYLADRELDGVPELYRVPLDGHGPARRVNQTLPPGGGVQADFVALAQGTLYRADQDADEVLELFLDREPSLRTQGVRRR